MKRNAWFLVLVMAALAGPLFFMVPCKAAPEAPPGADEVGAPDWGFKVKIPAGWSVAQKTERLAVLGCPGIHGALVVFPHALPDFARLATKMRQGLTDDNVQLNPLSPAEELPGEIVAGDYEGEYDGLHVKARWAGSMSPYGGGAYVIASARPEYYTPQLAGLADAMIRSVRFFEADVKELQRFFTGTWLGDGGQSRLVLSADGSYEKCDEGAAPSRGRWALRGTRFEGALLVTGPEGGRSVVEYRVRSEKGAVHWDQYRLGGKLYTKQP